MIIIDSRIGSGELQPLFPPGMSRIGKLQFGDAAFATNHNGEAPILIGIERKKIADLMSCMVTGRFSGHQLIGLLNSYNHVYLIVEGAWGTGNDGLLMTLRGKHWFPVEIGTRRFMTRDMLCHLHTLQVLTGINVWMTKSIYETVNLIKSLYHWWNDKQLDKHQSHLKEHISTVNFSKPNIVNRMAQQLPGIGYDRAKEIAKHFHSVQEMILANEADWQSIDGIGKTLSQRIVKELA